MESTKTFTVKGRNEFMIIFLWITRRWRKKEKKGERSDSTIMKSMDTWSWMCWSHEYHTWTSCIGCNNSTQFRFSLFHSFLELLRRVRWETYNTKNIACFQAIFWQLRLSKQPFISNLSPFFLCFELLFTSCHVMHSIIPYLELHCTSV